MARVICPGCQHSATAILATLDGQEQQGRFAIVRQRRSSIGTSRGAAARVSHPASISHLHIQSPCSSPPLCAVEKLSSGIPAGTGYGRPPMPPASWRLPCHSKPPGAAHASIVGPAAKGTGWAMQPATLSLRRARRVSRSRGSFHQNDQIGVHPTQDRRGGTGDLTPAGRLCSWLCRETRWIMVHGPRNARNFHQQRQPWPLPSTED